MAFKFSLRARLIVPNSGNAQGVVKARVEETGAENHYKLETLTAAGQGLSVWVGEAELLAANPK